MPADVHLKAICTGAAPGVPEADLAAAAGASVHLQEIRAAWPQPVLSEATAKGTDAPRYVQKVNQPVCAPCNRHPTMEPVDSSCLGAGGMGSAAADGAAGSRGSAAPGAAGGEGAGGSASMVAMWSVAGATPGMHVLDKFSGKDRWKGPPLPNTASFYCSDRAACTAAAYKAAADPIAAADTARVPEERPPAPKVPRATQATGSGRAPRGAAAAGASSAAAVGKPAAAGGGFAGAVQPRLVHFPRRGPIEEYGAFGPTFASMKVRVATV
jgi:hypothetical protein